MHQTSSKLTHADLHVSRIERDHRDIELLIGILEHGWINPVSGDQFDLVNNSIGKLAQTSIVKDIQIAYYVGQKAYKEFMKTGIDSNPPIVKFYDKIAKFGLKTFSAMTKKETLGKASGTEITLQADRNLFGHMILAAESQTLNLKDVRAHPLGPIPWALATPDGSLRKTNKAKFGKVVLQNTGVANFIPTPSACIIDGMGLIEQMRGDNQTFAELARHALLLVLHEGTASQRIDIVFDVYRELSIKTSEQYN